MKGFSLLLFCHWVGSCVEFGLQEAYAEQPIQAQVRLAQARSLLDEQRWSGAAEILKELLSEMPRDPIVNLEYSKALFFLGKREQALQILHPLISKKSGTREGGEPLNQKLWERYRLISTSFLNHEVFQIYQNGLVFLINDKTDEALEALSSAQKQDPSNGLILLRLAQAHLLSHRADVSKEYLEKATHVLWEKTGELSLWWGRYYFLSKKFKESLVEFNEAAKKISGSERLTLWMAQALFAQGLFDQAVNYLESRLKVYPMHLSSLLELAKQRVNPISGRLITEQDLLFSKKDAQVALSRVSEYAQKNKTESELGVEPKREGEVLKEEIAILLNRLEVLSKQQER